jgi:hypothetical protein
MRRLNCPRPPELHWCGPPPTRTHPHDARYARTRMRVPYARDGRGQGGAPSVPSRQPDATTQARAQSIAHTHTHTHSLSLCFVHVRQARCGGRKTRLGRSGCRHENGSGGTGWSSLSDSNSRSWQYVPMQIHHRPISHTSIHTPTNIHCKDRQTLTTTRACTHACAWTH